MTYVCPYCGKQKPSGPEWQQWSCCGEVGHAITEDEYEAIWAQNDQPQERSNAAQ